jgi:hypothetical protein
LGVLVIDAQITTSFGWAWLAATIALAVHVVDEATHDFLAWYNPRALGIRQALGGLPFPPTFTFLPWLLGLIAGILLLGALTPSAYAGRLWMRPAAYVLASIHIGNGLVHVVGSVLARRPVPGVLSAPLLLAAGGWLGYVAAHLP